MLYHVTVVVVTVRTFWNGMFFVDVTLDHFVKSLF